MKTSALAIDSENCDSGNYLTDQLVAGVFEPLGTPVVGSVFV